MKGIEMQDGESETGRRVLQADTETSSQKVFSQEILKHWQPEES